MLSCFDKKFQTCSSNAAYLLNAGGINFNYMNLKGIRLEDVDLSGGNFIRTNLERSQMKRVNLSSADFTESNLNNIDWRDIETKEVWISHKQNNPIWSVAFLPHSVVVASGRK